MKTPIIHPLMDSHEKDPIPFPRVLAFRPSTRLPEIRLTVARTTRYPGPADYTIREFQSLVGLERKADVSELEDGLFSSCSRVMCKGKTKHLNLDCQLIRLSQQCKYPILFLDYRWSDFYKQRPSKAPIPGHTRPKKAIPIGHIHDALVSCLTRYPNLTVIGPTPCRTAATRKMAGEWILRVMLGLAWANGTHAQPLFDIDDPPIIMTDIFPKLPRAPKLPKPPSLTSSPKKVGNKKKSP